MARAAVMIEDAAPAGSPGAPLVLVGLAGALTEAHQVGDVLRIDRVIDAEGAPHTPSWNDPFADLPAASLTTSAGALSTRGERDRLHRSTGATLVDQEAASFVALAERTRRPWAIIRAVSDGVEDRLPAGIDGWIDGSGQVRPLRIMAACLKRPMTIRSLLRLRRTSDQALQALTGSLRHALDRRTP